MNFQPAEHMSEHIDVLVIGNGFDLAHDLKTSYADFLFLHKYRPIKDILNKLSDIISEEGITKFRNLKQSFEQANAFHDQESLFDLILLSYQTPLPSYQISPGKFVCGEPIEFLIKYGSFSCYFDELCKEAIKNEDIEKLLGDIKNEVIEKFKQEKELNKKTRLDLQKKISEIKGKLKELEKTTISSDLIWFNFEEEIYKIIIQCNQRLSEINNTKNTTNGLFNPHNPDIPKRFITSVREFGKEPVIKQLNKELRALIADFYQHLYKETLGDNIQKLIRKPKFELFLEKKYQTHKLRVLNFNYTKTFEKLYAEDLKKKGFLFQDNHIIHIHGFIDESISNITYVEDMDKMNFVLGTQSFIDKNNIHPDFCIFTKDCQRHHYKTIKGYETLLKELNDLQKGSVTFHFIGHSLNNIDHEVLKPMLCIQNTAVRNSSINVYCHDEKSEEDLKNNMTNMIGKEEMARVTFKKCGDILQRI